MSPLFRLTLLIGGALALASVSAQAAIERVVEKNFSVQSGGALRVETSGGEVRVEPGSDSTVKVIARQRIRAKSEAEADELLKKLTLTIEQTGNDVSAVARYERRPGGWSFKSWPPVQVDFIVTVPARYSVDLKTSGGNVVVGNLEGTARVRTSGGDVRLARIAGDVDAGTSGGNVRVEEGTAAVAISTSGGDIELGRSGGPARVRTSGGNVFVKRAEGLLDASTSGGDVRAVFAAGVTGDSVLSTSGGNVEVTVPKNAGFLLDASTSGGQVNATGLTLTIEKGGAGKNHLTGTVNSGGPRLKLRTSGGDIVVRAD